MINNKYLTVLLSFTFLISCSPKLSSVLVKDYQSLAYDEEVVVFDIDEDIPEEFEQIGVLKARDTGFSVKCNYEIVLDKAKLEARKAGGNAIKITMHKKPDFWSTCHRIDAIILKTPIKYNK
ncbi:hypothetical protein M3P19_14595 [Muricauda sp. 2012CJ35-5]|uniref:Lipoprotein n=1 Tax=Flagellimonas spongiicola TaxID=2942208 RepID=A0ABT0PV55_9FLAO|nr:hypothetical protein [Allomuricauda spongiicola]MCL6275247.1 hypothetical protein [Allomuricauda spongiicola]